MGFDIETLFDLGNKENLEKLLSINRKDSIPDVDSDITNTDKIIIEWLNEYEKNNK